MIGSSLAKDPGVITALGIRLDCYGTQALKLQNGTICVLGLGSPVYILEATEVTSGKEVFPVEHTFISLGIQGKSNIVCNPSLSTRQPLSLLEIEHSGFLSTVGLSKLI